MQNEPTTIDIFTDSDWAGCRKTRKSTSGGCIMAGGHCIKAWSKTQAVVATSSAEAELYAVVRGATESLGVATLYHDFGQDIKLQMHIDAMAAKGILERQGLSKVRHIDVNVLWLQEQCARKILPLQKVPGESNPADLMTKHLGLKNIKKDVEFMNMEYSQGRAAKAAQLHTVEDVIEEEPEKLWNVMQDWANDQQGGDRWKFKGTNGTWHRLRTTPGRSLFTPYKVAKGPGQGIKINPKRFTRGITQSGNVSNFTTIGRCQ